jgi:RNA polymerase sigma-70 factor (ECF subfamily)
MVQSRHLVTESRRERVARNFAAELVDDVVAAIDRACLAWPAFEVNDDAMIAAIVRSLADGTPLTALFVDDLYFAQACAAGLPAGVAELEHMLATPITANLRSMGLGATEVGEVLQDIRVKLLVSGDGPAKIATYSGRAPLRGWLRIVATRAALDRFRRQTPPGNASDDLVEAAATVDSPELELFRRKYHSEFKQAFETAVASLEIRERNCLRHYFVDGLTTEEIGSLYGVHKSTAHRWVEAARDLVTKRTRNNFQELAKLPAAELDSILRLLRSQLDLSLSRNLFD